MNNFGLSGPVGRSLQATDWDRLIIIFFTKGSLKKMTANGELSGNKRFPCPVCVLPREVRITKKRKPYLICDPCGVQLFIRGPAGIAEFNRLVERGERDGLSQRINEIESRFRLTCPECGNRFWAEPRLLKTSSFDGSLKGFRCPNKACGAIVPWRQSA